jgi:RNA recognition motif-containing protein
MAPFRSHFPEPSLLYVDGIPDSYSESDLCRLFAPFGTVRYARVIYAWDGAPLEVGEIVMNSPQEADNAARALHGSQITGRTLLVYRNVVAEEPDR